MKSDYEILEMKIIESLNKDFYIVKSFIQNDIECLELIDIDNNKKYIVGSMVMLLIGDLKIDQFLELKDFIDIVELLLLDYDTD